jgi:hypothetical protein
MMNEVLCRCLDDLASRLDENQEMQIHAVWEGFLHGDVKEGFFRPPHRKPSPAKVDWPKIPINNTLHDPQLMVLDQMYKVSDVLAKGGNAILNVRSNYGVSIMVSQLGCEVIEMPPQQGNTPTAMALGSEDAIREAVEKGVPDLRAGQGADVFDTAELFLEVLGKWPVIGRHVHLYHPDAQGPMDNAELAWGSDIFLAFYDTPDLVHAFLDLMTEHYIAFMRKWFELVPPAACNAHWGLLHEGNIVLRDDSLMNLSPAVYAEFIRDHEARCLRELGGGMIHFCGRGDHFIEQVSSMQTDGLTAINMSQPHLNDMEIIYTHTVDRGLKLIGFDTQWAKNAVNAGRPLHGQVLCPND